MNRINAHAASTVVPLRGNRPTRRQFLQSSAALAGVTLLPGCSNLPFSAPSTSKVRTIGALSVHNAVVKTWMDAWEQRLGELGHKDGQNIVVERRIARSIDGFDSLAAELVGLKVDVIMATGWAAMRAARQLTSTIPIVGISSDPVATGLVESIQRPGGNVTGLTTLSVGLAAKRVEVFKETIAGLKRPGVMWNSSIPDRSTEFEETERAARLLGLDVLGIPVQSPEDFESGFVAASNWRADGVMLLFDQLTFPEADVSNDGSDPLQRLLSKYHLPAVCDVQEWAEGSGGLTTYGPNFRSMFGRAAEFVDKILSGVKPADIPIEQPARFALTINLKTAAAMGLTIPPSALALADKVIQ